MEKGHQRLGPADGHGRRADGIFEDQIPADDPGQEFAHGCVGICVGAAGDGNHGSEFAITKSCKAAADRSRNERKHDCGAGMGGGGYTGQRENARADDGADAESDECRWTQRPLERMLAGHFGFGQNAFHRLYRE